jgi:hypothetical protein
MLTEHGRLLRQKALERDAEAAVHVLTPEEKQSLKVARASAAVRIPESHEKRLVELCLGVYRSGEFALTDLGRVAAELDYRVKEPPRE